MLLRNRAPAQLPLFSQEKPPQRDSASTSRRYGDGTGRDILSPSGSDAPYKDMSTSDYKMEIDNPTKEKAIKTAVNDISTDLASVSKDLKSISDQLPALVATRREINSFKDQTDKYNTRLADAAAVIEKGVKVSVDPAKLSEGHVQLLTNLNEKSETWNRRWSTLCKSIASTGKIKVVFTAAISALITAAFMLLAYENSPHVWAHRGSYNLDRKSVV